jgi:small subunit ribosomal protein S8
MSMSDPISDLLTRIRNAQRVNFATVECLASKTAERILEVLKSEGYIRGFRSEEIRPGISKLVVELKYHEGMPAIRELKRVSKPGRRTYSRISDLKKVYNGLGVAILSTSKGILSDAQARQINVGGEVLFQVF